MAATASIIHADLDAFYASVEQLLDPDLRGRPVLVGGGVVLAASYEAREFGIHAPMGIRQALARCPHAVVVRGSFTSYQELSDRVFTICEDFTPIVEQISIDEAFLDVAGVAHLLGAPVGIAAALRRRVKDETGLNLSVGVACTKFLAKVASAAAKPDGMLHVEPGTELEFLHPLPVRAMWGVGPVMERRLRERGIATIGELAAVGLPTLRSWLGPGAAAHFHALSWNRDPRPVSPTHRAGSVGAQRALGRGTDDLDELGRILLGLADRVGTRLRAKHRAGRTLTVRVRFPDMTSATRATTLPQPISSTAALHHAGLPLLADAATSRPGRKTLVGISVSNLERFSPLQLELPLEPGEPTRPGSPLGHAHLRVDEGVDRARDRFGKKTVGRASLLLGDDGGVPDEFRELAERD